MTSFSTKVVNCLFVLAACNLALSHCFSTNRKSFNESSTRESQVINLEEEYESAHLEEGDIQGIATHKVLGSDGKLKTSVNLWPGGKVPYVIDEDGATEKMRNVLQQAIEQYDLHTCVRFVPRTDEDSYVRFFFTGEGCYSKIGKMRDPQDISLSPTSCRQVTVVMHEMMHAIGFIHEQMRPDRDNFIYVYFEHIKEEMKFNFYIMEDAYADLGSEYDINSIMQYQETAFAKPGEKSMKAKNGERLGPLQPDGQFIDGQFAESDLYEINKLYNCNVEEKKPNEEPVEEPINPTVWVDNEETIYTFDDNGNLVTTITVNSFDEYGNPMTIITVNSFDEYGTPVTTITVNSFDEYGNPVTNTETF